MSQPTGIEEESKLEPLPLQRDSEEKKKRFRQIVAQTPKVEAKEFIFGAKVQDDRKATMENSFISDNDISKIQNIANMI